MGEYLHSEYNKETDVRKNLYKKSEEPKVSVIIPIYNVEKYLNRSLDSVVNQTLEDIEIILINDHTPDNSMKIVKEYAQNDERFVILEQETNQGQGVARNRALDIAQGEYIMFLDPDDALELDACEKAYNQIFTNNNDIVFFNFYSYLEKDNRRKLNTKRITRLLQLNSNDIKLYENSEIIPWGGLTWCQIYSRKFLNENNIRFSSHRYAEDLPFTVKSFVYSESVSVIEQALYNQRVKKNYSIVDYTDHYTDVLETKELALEIVEQSPKKDCFLQSFINYEIFSNIAHLKNFARKNKKIKQDFFNKLKSHFENLVKRFPQIDFQKCQKYNDFELILKCKSFDEFWFKRILRKAFKNG